MLARHRLGRVGPVANRLDRPDEVVRILLGGESVRALDHGRSRRLGEEAPRGDVPEPFPAA